MLKIRTFIIALSLTPLLSLNWQLPSQAQNSPSLGTAGGGSGGGSTGSSGNTNSNPSLGTGGSQSGGGSTGSSGNTNSNPSVGTAGGQSGGGSTGSNLSNPRNGRLESNSRNVILERDFNGRVTLRLSPETEDRFNQKLAELLSRAQAAPDQNRVILALVGNVENSQFVVNALESFLISAEVGSELAQPFIGSLRGSLLYIPQDTGSRAGVVDLGQFNTALNLYNRIIAESSPTTLVKLQANQEFVAIGEALKELRQVIGD